MEAAFDAVEEAFGGIDVVVNTAGIMVLAPIAELDLDDLDRMHRTNIRGTFVVAQQAARRVRAGGAIVDVLDVGDAAVVPHLRRLRRQQGRRRGPRPRPRPRAARPRRHRQRRRARAHRDAAVPRRQGPRRQVAGLAKAAPLERLGQPDDIAEAVAFLAGPARWVNGQILFANGGLA